MAEGWNPCPTIKVVLIVSAFALWWCYIIGMAEIGVGVIYEDRITNNEEVEKLTENVTEFCDDFTDKERANECRVDMVSNYIYDNYNHTTNKSFSDVHELLDRNSTDCKGRTVLFNSMMKTVNISTFVILEPGHMCSGYFIDGEARTRGCSGNISYHTFDRDSYLERFVAENMIEDVDYI